MKNSHMTFKSVADLRRRFSGSPLELLEQYVNGLDTSKSVVSKMFFDTHSMFLQSANFS